MTDHSHRALVDELEKIAFWGELWTRFTDLFRNDQSKAKRKLDYHFSPKAGTDKWDKFLKNVRSPEFVSQVDGHPLADSKLKSYAHALHGLSRGKTVWKVKSESLPGKTYEVRETAEGRMGCTCPHWQFVCSLTPGTDCKHIRAYREGKAKVASGGFLPLLLRIQYEEMRRDRWNKRRREPSSTSSPKWWTKS